MSPRPALYSGCLAALRELEQKGHFVLPAANDSYKKEGPKRLGKPVPEPVGVPDEVGKIKELRRKGKIPYLLQLDMSGGITNKETNCAFYARGSDQSIFR